jgi:hypothetical protein
MQLSLMTGYLDREHPQRTGAGRPETRDQGYGDTGLHSGDRLVRSIR